MKHFLLCILSLLVGYTSAAQDDFTGIAKYKITVEGNNNPITDSMLVIFDKQKVKVILYLPDIKHPGHVLEKDFIDDFSAKRSFELNEENRTYKSDTLKTSAKYDFINTMKIAEINNVLCFQYKADSTDFDRSQILGAYCLASIDYRNSFMSKYFFLGIQPIIINNRIVMDFVVTKPGGIKQIIYISGITKLNNTQVYFDLNGYKEEK